MPKNQTVAEFLAQAIEISGKTQTEIAKEVGYGRPNIISMMKQGMSKVPIEKIPALSKALGIDPALFLRRAMNEYQPETWAVITSVMGDIPTEAEMKAVRALRAAEAEGSINLDTTSEGDFLKMFRM